MRRLLPILLVALLPASLAAQERHRFEHERVLGTSLELVVVADSAEAAKACEAAVLAEIERLRKILSGWDERSELSRLNRAKPGERLKVSPELIEVLRTCETWRRETHGAFCMGADELLALWKGAAKAGHPPSDDALFDAVSRIRGDLTRSDREAGTVWRTGPATVRPDAMAKGYIIDKAGAAGAARPGVRGLMLDIGGDLRVWGSAGAAGKPWAIGVADPASPADNAKPLAELHLADRAVATSAGYARWIQIGEHRFSEVIDPRTGHPSQEQRSVTVIAPTAAMADALATAMMVVHAEGALDLMRKYEGCEALLVDGEGRRWLSAGWRAALAPRSESAWPADKALHIDLELPRAKGSPYRRPYVAIWIEDAKGKRVRTLVVWGGAAVFLPSLRRWSREADTSPRAAASVTRATRRPGRYQLIWKGRDDRMRPLPPGKYTVNVEVVRQYGGREHRRATIACGGEAAEASMRGRRELGEVKLRFGASEPAPPAKK